ncbi:recombinase family protein [Paenibacillus periandrae]|uniref:recombinase family protein n=1 Tax=Paenibacillus periandrae TaxID=1761741 RepID=UPI0030844C4A
MKREVAYTRFPSDNQRDESIDAQVRAIEIYWKEKGFELIKVYADRAKSATSDKRHEFLQMIAKLLFLIVTGLDHRRGRRPPSRHKAD